MASTQELNLKINGDTLGAVNSLKALEAELVRLQKLAKDPSLSFDQLKTLSSSISKTKGEIAGLNSVVGKSTKDFSGWTRVIQDAPFGFIAISNNLTQLIPAAGAAGLAFSGLVAAISFAQVGFQNWVRGGEEGKKMSEELAEAIKEIGRAADLASEDIDKFKSSLDFAKEIGSLEAQISNFGKIGSGNIEILQLEDRLNSKLIDRVALQKKLLEESQAELNVREARAAVGSEESTAIKAEQQKILSQLIDFNFKDGELRGNHERFILQIKLAGLQNQKQIDEAAKKQGEQRLRDLEKQLKAEQDFELRRMQAREASISGGGTILVPQMVELAKLKAKNNPSETLGQQIMNEVLPKKLEPRINVAPVLNFDLTDAEKQAFAFAGQLQGILTNAVSGGLIGIGEAIGTALATGQDPIKAAFTGIIGMMADLISQMGKALIEYGVINSAIQKIVAGGIVIPGAVAIAAGLAAVTAGALLKNSFKPKGFAEGGLVFGPTVGLVGEGRGTNRSNPEVIAPLDKLKGMLGGVGGGR